jgi:hypothetical protein
VYSMSLPYIEDVYGARETLAATLAGDPVSRLHVRSCFFSMDASHLIFCLEDRTTEIVI